MGGVENRYYIGFVYFIFVHIIWTEMKDGRRLDLYGENGEDGAQT